MKYLSSYNNIPKEETCFPTHFVVEKCETLEMIIFDDFYNANAYIRHQLSKEGIEDKEIEFLPIKWSGHKVGYCYSKHGEPSSYTLRFARLAEEELI